MKKTIKKIQNLSEPKKMIIFFVVMAIAVVGVGFFGFFSTISSIFKISDSVKSIDFSATDKLANLQPENTSVVLPVAPETPKDETANWKTYKNVPYGFEIKYPKDWIEPILDAKKNEVSFNGIIFVNYYKNESEMTGGISFDKWVASPATGFVEDSKESIVFGASYSGIKIKSSYCNSVPFLTNSIFTQSNFESFDPAKEPVYNIRGPIFRCGVDKNIIDRDYVDFENIFSNMLSTLKFIK